MGIRWRSWLLSGLLAGLVISVSGTVLAHAVLGPEYVAAFRSHTAGPAPPLPAIIAQNLSLRFLYGLLGLFFYVGFRPRFGPGPGTALLAGAALAAGTYLPALVHLHQFGILTGAKLWIAAAWGLGEAMTACLLGAWLYREAPPTPCR
ncbi:MAG TPA: hypothetical protein VID50_03170 [Candidatus Eisenbacteria bacterium]